MIIDDSRNVLAHLKAELHEESAVKASADMNIGDIVYSCRFIDCEFKDYSL